jgi:hypothetical protein
MGVLCCPGRVLVNPSTPPLRTESSGTGRGEECVVSGNCRRRDQRPYDMRKSVHMRLSQREMI